MAHANSFQRVVLIVLDGVGIGALPDASEYGDQDAATLPHVAAAVGGLPLNNLAKLGLGELIDLPDTISQPKCCYWGRMAEQSEGKDSVTGHWELAGVIQDKAFATFPHGFPAEIIDQFAAETGLAPLGNIAASGTDILRQLGEEHVRTGRPIVYTSSDSVFQIAAHEDVIPPEQLYGICRIAEKILLPFNVCRVIARPFSGTSADNFKRTSGRHDFPQKPSAPTLLQKMKKNGFATYGVGKINDLFAGEGLSKVLPSKNNAEGMAKTLQALAQIKYGLVMTNLVDFDMLYGHRLDYQGFASALLDFDRWLPELQQNFGDQDLLLITADHGCDPTTPGTDHTREYVPLLAWSPSLREQGSLGERSSFADVGATIAENFAIDFSTGHSFLADLV
ncbi:phosphopentomutase [Malonomonas rubra DSM 5091]|uniref:Phosphopentomutase n=1 Tax=Malonomonas rubra DSM 5091 TaxID=1122189 RepID=A0A1M6BYM6_MALRU|nr:phosphopentomutase [Malonomonas rubra]SHI53548.1 phosphopentomutase [Malonomonas rubra DSM 5091]